MRDRLEEIIAAFSNVYSGWILWNLFLAFVPLALSFWLFRRQKPSRTLWWWIGAVVFLAMLPNAPYMLTDIIHLIRGTRIVSSTWIIALVFIPLHVVAILGGFFAYVMALINVCYYLKRQLHLYGVVWAELGIHALCAIGIYLGRFRRFNSWDLIVTPGNVFVNTLDDLTSKRPLFVMTITFVILTVSYWIAKQITLGLILRIRYAQRGIDVFE